MFMMKQPPFLGIVTENYNISVKHAFQLQKPKHTRVHTEVTPKS